jgi:hypothetical protein
VVSKILPPLQTITLSKLRFRSISQSTFESSQGLRLREISPRSDIEVGFKKYVTYQLNNNTIE